MEVEEAVDRLMAEAVIPVLHHILSRNYRKSLKLLHN
jgi:hypothetical protein